MSTHVEELEQRLTEGASVTPKQLAEARAADELAELKARAAARRAKEEAAAERRDTLEALRSRLFALATGGPVEEARADLAAALDRYFDAAARRNAEFYDIADEVTRLGYADDPKSGVTAMGDGLRIGDAFASRLRPHASLERTVTEAYRKHFPRGFME